MIKDEFAALLREHAEEFYKAGLVCEPMGTDRGHSIERQLLEWFEALAITRDDAEVIARMEEVCTMEGIGPNSEELMRRISARWPDVIPPILREALSKPR